MQSIKKANTLLESILRSMEYTARYAPGEVRPAAILWPDSDGQWKAVIPQLLNLMPQLLIFGPYSPSERQGPAIWLRCVIEKTLPGVNIPEGTVPVIYMPNISRQRLRSVEDCPWELQPLVELQYRGATWCQRNGKDWTVEAYLISDDSGLELDVARDSQTKRAMLGALTQLAITPLARLRGKRLEAEDFDKLMIEDTPRNLLEWMNDPQGTRQKWDGARWSAFRSRCKSEYAFDPQADGEFIAAERLGLREGTWLCVWERFVEAPALYPALPSLLRKVKPSGLIFDPEPWPSENDSAEESLRQGMLQLANADAIEARKQIAILEKEHAVRRQWVWAKLGQSPLVKSLAHLSILSSRTNVVMGGDSLETLADLYAQEGYLADDAVLCALSEVKSQMDIQVISAAARKCYLPWIQDSAEHFQKVIAGSHLPQIGGSEQEPVVAEAGTCILFVDGLRFDLGQRLALLAEDRKFRVSKGRRWAAAPTVTATSKPAVMPVADKIIGNQLGDDFLPDVVDTGQSVTNDRLKKLLSAAGFQWLAASEVGNPLEEGARAWTEYGELDRLGHTLQCKIVSQIEDHLYLLVDRIEMLLSAGWKQVRVVTDHGWLLVPGGLPSIALPKYLTESRWARCAKIKETAHIAVPTTNWYWNPAEFFAYGPGVYCFGHGNQYAHGGISLQECLIPDLTITPDAAGPAVVAQIADLQWLGLRCRVTVKPAGVAVKADLRTKAGDASTSIADTKSVDAEGKVGLLVEDETKQGMTVSLVLLDSNGHVVAKKATTVGGEE